MIGAAAVQRTLVFVGAAGTMSSLQSLRELISERLAAAAEEICRLCEGTIVQYEQELCRQRRLLDICWKPQLQLHHIVLPQHYVTEEEDHCNHQRNFRVEREEPAPPWSEEAQKEPESAPIKEELDETELLQFKVEPEELCISQDKSLLDLKQEIDSLIEIPTYEENKHSEADLNKQQSFNVNSMLDEKGNQNEESTSTPDEETDPQSWKRRDRSFDQNVDRSDMLESQCDSVVRKKSNKATLVEKCQPSPEEGSSRFSIYPHMRAETSERYFVCKECGKSYKCLSRLRYHMRTHTGEKLFSCKKCEKRFSQICNLRTHMRIHTHEKPFTCKECNSSFSQISHLKMHTRTHTGEKPFSCKECKSSFSQTSHLKTHMRIHTGEKPFACRECDRRFSESSSLKKHMRTHTGEKPFNCKECNRRFSESSSLKRHMRTHTHEKPFTCKECNSSFSQRSHLKTHIRTHTGEKPFSCIECDKSFSQVINLKTHMGTHTGEKPFTCEECGTRFGHISNLKSHMRTHTGEKPFTCEECGTRFGHISNLKSHMKTHTGEKPFVKNVIEVLVL